MLIFCLCLLAVFLFWLFGRVITIHNKIKSPDNQSFYRTIKFGIQWLSAL
jgi:hypothetical protein